MQTPTLQGTLTLGLGTHLSSTSHSTQPYKYHKLMSCLLNPGNPKLEGRNRPHNDRRGASETGKKTDKQAANP